MRRVTALWAVSSCPHVRKEKKRCLWTCKSALIIHQLYYCSDYGLSRYWSCKDYISVVDALQVFCNNNPNDRRNMKMLCLLIIRGYMAVIFPTLQMCMSVWSCTGNMKCAWALSQSLPIVMSLLYLYFSACHRGLDVHFWNNLIIPLLYIWLSLINTVSRRTFLPSAPFPLTPVRKCLSFTWYIVTVLLLLAHCVWMSSFYLNWRRICTS